MQTDVSIKSSTPLSAGTGKKEDHGYTKKISQTDVKLKATKTEMKLPAAGWFVVWVLKGSMFQEVGG